MGRGHKSEKTFVFSGERAVPTTSFCAETRDNGENNEKKGQDGQQVFTEWAFLQRGKCGRAVHGTKRRRGQSVFSG